MGNLERWTLYVCGDCGKAAGDGSHICCDLRAKDQRFEVVRADLHQGAVEALDALARGHVPHEHGYDLGVPQTVREFARAAAATARGQ